MLESESTWGAWDMRQFKHETEICAPQFERNVTKEKFTSCQPFEFEFTFVLCFLSVGGVVLWGHSHVRSFCSTSDFGV